MIAKQAERRLKQAFKGTVKPFRLAREKVNDNYQSPILSKYEKLATKNALKFSIEDIYRMPAMEESNIGRAQQIAKERQLAVRPMQKVLRAAQFIQFNPFKVQKNSSKIHLRAGYGELCEEQNNFEQTQIPAPLKSLDAAGSSEVQTEESEIANDIALERQRIQKQILLDLSSTTRNVVAMPHRVSTRYLRKSVLIHQFDDTLYSEPLGVRQVMGLTTWNKLLQKQHIPNKVLKDMLLGSKEFQNLVSETESSDEAEENGFRKSSSLMPSKLEHQQQLDDHEDAEDTGGEKTAEEQPHSSDDHAEQNKSEDETGPINHVRLPSEVDTLQALQRRVSMIGNIRKNSIS